MDAVSLVFTTLRTQVAPLMGDAEDPQAELLALVWGPRFDRLQARELVACAPAPAAPRLQRALGEAADRFDCLPGERQQRLRRLILKPGRWENPRHAPHPADRR